jgi:hypothetical protein
VSGGWDLYESLNPCGWSSSRGDRELTSWCLPNEIGGNKYRLIVDVRYDLGRIYVRRVLTHEQYDRRSDERTL